MRALNARAGGDGTARGVTRPARPGVPSDMRRSRALRTVGGRRWPATPVVGGARGQDACFGGSQRCGERRRATTAACRRRGHGRPLAVSGAAWRPGGLVEASYLVGPLAAQYRLIVDVLLAAHPHR